MRPDQLRTAQAPFKERYKADPESAKAWLRADGRLFADSVSCEVASPQGPIRAGLHPATGGDGSFACSAEMLLQALVGCTGVTLRAVAAAMGIPLRSGTIVAEGLIDFRGTLGVNKETLVGFQEIRLKIDLDADATPEQMDNLLKLTKRYCVVYQTLAHPPVMTLEVARGSGSASG